MDRCGSLQLEHQAQEDEDSDITEGSPRGGGRGGEGRRIGEGSDGVEGSPRGGKRRKGGLQGKGHVTGSPSQGAQPSGPAAEGGQTESGWRLQLAQLGRDNQAASSWTLWSERLPQLVADFQRGPDHAASLSWAPPGSSDAYPRAPNGPDDGLHHFRPGGGRHLPTTNHPQTTLEKVLGIAGPRWPSAAGISSAALYDPFPYTALDNSHLDAYAEAYIQDVLRPRQPKPYSSSTMGLDFRPEALRTASCPSSFLGHPPPANLPNFERQQDRDPPIFGRGSHSRNIDNVLEADAAAAAAVGASAAGAGPASAAAASGPLTSQLPSALPSAREAEEEEIRGMLSDPIIRTLVKVRKYIGWYRITRHWQIAGRTTIHTLDPN